MTEEEIQKEIENSPAIRFIKSRTFYVIALILCAIGILIALMTDGLKTSRVPSVSEQVRPNYGNESLFRDRSP